VLCVPLAHRVCEMVEFLTSEIPDFVRPEVLSADAMKFFISEPDEGHRLSRVFVRSLDSDC